jgi:hypothetical protein
LADKLVVKLATKLAVVRMATKLATKLAVKLAVKLADKLAVRIRRQNGNEIDSKSKEYLLPAAAIRVLNGRLIENKIGSQLDDKYDLMLLYPLYISIKL